MAFRGAAVPGQFVVLYDPDLHPVAHDVLAQLQAAVRIAHPVREAIPISSFYLAVEMREYCGGLKAALLEEVWGLHEKKTWWTSGSVHVHGRYGLSGVGVPAIL